MVSVSTVAILPTANLAMDAAGLELVVPTLAETRILCPGEPYADQPVAAICAGVLLDRDLVLTAGHCVHALPLTELRVGFDFVMSAPGEPVTALTETVRIAEVVAEARSAPSAVPRLDYAWLRLVHPVSSKRRVASVRRRGPPDAGQSFSTFGFPAGVPMKGIVDARIADARAERRDYFVANADTSHGWSGGGAFDEEMALFGILSRGEPDFFRTDAGCERTFTAEDADAGEEFTYAEPALTGLCLVDPTRSLCGNENQDRTSLLAPPAEAGGCQVNAGSHALNMSLGLVLVAFMGLLRSASPRRRADAGRLPDVPDKQCAFIAAVVLAVRPSTRAGPKIALEVFRVLGRTENEHGEQRRCRGSRKL